MTLLIHFPRSELSYLIIWAPVNTWAVRCVMLSPQTDKKNGVLGSAMLNSDDSSVFVWTRQKILFWQCRKHFWASLWGCKGSFSGGKSDLTDMVYGGIPQVKSVLEERVLDVRKCYITLSSHPLSLSATYNPVVLNFSQCNVASHIHHQIVVFFLKEKCETSVSSVYT